jgi:hypothetical protein
MPDIGHLDLLRLKNAGTPQSLLAVLQRSTLA